MAGFSLCRSGRRPGIGHVGDPGGASSRGGNGALGVARCSSTRSMSSGPGTPKAALGVDAENTTGAVRLYESAGMRVTHRLDIYEKVLA